MTGDKQYDLFISYVEADRDWVRGYLFTALYSAGIRYISETDFVLGQPRVTQFEQAVQKSDRTVLIISPAYMAGWSEQFINVLVVSYGLTTETWPVIPLILKEAELPSRLSVLVQLNLIDQEDWEEQIKRLCKDIKSILPAPEAQPACPYPGMTPFSKEQSNRFFGRDDEITEVVEKLRLHGFVSVIGPSGGGKSSLIFAGVLPALQKRRHFGSGDWRVLSMRPGKKPLSDLKALLEHDGEAEPAVRQVLSGHVVRLLLFIDQFEETFTLKSEEALVFQEYLLAASKVPGCHLILTIRADFYAELMSSSLWRKIKTSRLELAPLDEQGLRQAILKPAESVGVFMETSLLERLTTDAIGEPGTLPLVQETLVLLWERLERRFLPLAAYETLVLPHKSYGGLKPSGLHVALIRRADAALAELDDPGEAIARRIFLRLVQFGEGRPDTRRRQTLEALRTVGEPSGRLENIVSHLADRRLLTLGGEKESASKTVDIAHEALIASWPVLQQWIREHRHAELTRRHLAARTTEWVRLGKDRGGLLDEAGLAEATQWLQSPDALELGYQTVLSEFVAASENAIRKNRERELNLIKAALDQERKARKSAQIRNFVALVSVVILAGLTVLTFRESMHANLKAIESSSAHASALFAAGKELESLRKGVESAHLLQSTRFATEETKIRVTTSLREIVYGIRERNRLTGHTSDVTSVVFSPDGRLIASASLDYTIRLWESTGKHLQTLPAHNKGVFTVRFSPDGQYLLSAGIDYAVRIWQRQSGGKFHPLQTIPDQYRLSLVDFLPAGDRIVTADEENILKIWNFKGKLVSVFQGAVETKHTGRIMAVAFSPDGRIIASASMDKNIKLWDMDSGSLIRTILTDSEVYHVRFLDDQLLISAHQDKIINLWRDGKRMDSFAGHTDSVLYLDISTDRQMIVSAGKDHSVRLWDRQGRQLQQFEGHTHMVSEANFSPDGKKIVSGGIDQTIRIWEIDGMVAPVVLKGSSFSFSPDGQMIVSGSEREKSVRLWDKEGRLIRTFSMQPARIMQVAFSPGEKKPLIAAAGLNGKISLFTIDGQKHAILKSHGDGVLDVAFSPDGQLIVGAGKDGLLRLWRSDGKTLGTFGHGAGVSAVDFGPDGKTLVSGSTDKTVRLWDTQGNLLQTLRGHESTVLGVSFSPNGKLIASGSADKTIRIWRKNGEAVRTLRDHANSVFSVRFSPDNRIIASASSDNTVKLWSLETGLLYSFDGSGEMLFNVGFSPDGKLLASAGFDEQVLLWNLDLDLLFSLGCAWLGEYFASQSIDYSCN